MFRHIRQWFLVLLFGYIGASGFRAGVQENPPSNNDIPSVCHSIPTKYTNLESLWWWRDADTVVFSVSPGNGKNGLFPNPIVWYQYHPSTDQLEELKDDPSNQVSNISSKLLNQTDIQTDPNGSYRNVAISPTGDRFVYPRIGLNEGSYWYFDSKTGIKTNLDVPAQIGVANISLNTFWSADAKRFVVQGQSWSNGYVPIKIITLKDQKVMIEALTDLSPFSTYGEGFWLSNFRVMGISTDGQYIVIQPETMDNISWLYNLDTQQLSTINFSLRGEQVIWLNATTFVATTAIGAVEYDIQKQTRQTLVASEQLKSIGQSWSSDGRFLIGQYSDETGSVGRKNIICQVR